MKKNYETPVVEITKYDKGAVITTNVSELAVNFDDLNNYNN